MLIKLLPYLIALGIIVAAGFYVHHRIYASGYADGKAEVQAQFDTFKQQQTDLATKAQQEAGAKEAAAKVTNAKALANYQRQLSLSHGYADYLVSRLRPYLSASAGGVPQGGDQPGATHPGQTPSATGVGERIGDALAECRSNDAQLDSLRDQLIPQLK